MPYRSILAAFYSDPLAILPEKLEEVRAFLHLKAEGKDIKPEQLAAVVGSRRPDGVQMAGRVAVVPVFGVIAQRTGMLAEASGGVSAERLGATLDALAEDKQVRSIVLAFDSPGGSVYGIEELGAKIRGLRDRKKIVGLADSVAASAAYWLIAQTSEVNVTPGGQVGSIGVLSAHQDISELEAKLGVKTTVVTSAPYKAEMAPIAPLSEEARGEMQAKVQHYHGLFTKAVAKGRGVSEARVEADFGKGRMVTAQAAVDRGMADRVATLEQVLRRLDAGDLESAQTAKAVGHDAKWAAARVRALEVIGA